jgi:hypothetical protein
MSPSLYISRQLLHEPTVPIPGGKQHRREDCAGNLQGDLPGLGHNRTLQGKYTSHYALTLVPLPMLCINVASCDIDVMKTFDKYVFFQCPTSEADWREVAEGYYDRWNFPNTLGSIDGKHVRVRQPAHSGSHFYNYKHFYSIVLMAVVDSRYR